MKNYKGLAHIAVYTTDLACSIRFYEALGGTCTMRGEVQKKTGVNQLAMIHLLDFEIELIEPRDGTVVTTEGGVIPHFAIEVENLPLVVDSMRAMGIDTFCTEQQNVMPELFGGLQNIFFRGPSGEMIELIEHFDIEPSRR
ncbi:MAG: VOC family protein [Butyricicoccus pullicaecorum]|nr:VOC family protein [Butyricicoccus pullicaecorum]MDO4668619.1 VOC family protein [Butyricicoccus pullicaecorum]